MRTFYTKHEDFERATALGQFDVACSKDVDYAYAASEIIGHFDHTVRHGLIAADPADYRLYCEEREALHSLLDFLRERRTK